MPRCTYNGCLEEARWVLIYNRPMEYYCEEHAKYIMLNDGVQGRWFRIEDYRERDIKEILASEGGEATLERVAYLSGKSIEEITRIAINENIKMVRRKYSLSQDYYTTYLVLEGVCGD
ncbi:MAG: hypothetical protein LZ174_09625 [Thaumarchaeota archaeon]|nr:hypothetical protein [Candidatus Geocrenenecus arthurdayi]